jgi:hypothetical protein
MCSTGCALVAVGTFDVGWFVVIGLTAGITSCYAHRFDGSDKN